MLIQIQGEELKLLPDRALYWPSKRTLIISDVHLGKTGHFRKHGIAVPNQLHFADLSKIDGLISSLLPKQIIFLGDLFHSDFNSDWWPFVNWIKGYNEIQFLLVKGNHDIIPEQYFVSAGMIVKDRFVLAPFDFTHIQEDTAYYNISGHVHPGVRLLGAGKQGVTLPCFHFSKNHGLLPAFGIFTGLGKISPRKGDGVYVIAEDQIIDVSRNS